MDLLDETGTFLFTISGRTGYLLIVLQIVLIDADFIGAVSINIILGIDRLTLAYKSVGLQKEFTGFS